MLGGRKFSCLHPIKKPYFLRWSSVYKAWKKNKKTKKQKKTKLDNISIVGVVAALVEKGIAKYSFFFFFKFF